MTPRHAWHAATIAEVREAFDVARTGLSSAEAAKRLEQSGPNRLPQARPTPVWRIAARQFASPLILILFVAAVVSLVMHPDEPTDAAFIAIVLVLNALIGGFQEWKAERSSRALQQLLQIRATVLRDGEMCEIDGQDVVPGDVVWLESGNRVPADLRLTTSHGLEIDESLLTGESLAVTKDADSVCEAATPMADRNNMAFAGSMVQRGRAEGVVIATGSATSVGQLALDVTSRTGGRPPLLDRMAEFTRVVAWCMVVAVVVIAVVGVLWRGYGATHVFMFAVALAVSAIPEGLPVALTVALAVATTRMAKRGVIVRRLAAVEGLGSCTLIASDKTGTLTCNELTARVVELADGTQLEVTGEGFAPEGEVLSGGEPVQPTGDSALLALARTAVLCNEADLYERDDSWTWRGDPTDIALLSLAHKLGVVRAATLAEAPQVNDIAFEAERQFAASFNRLGEEIVASVKGAPERVLDMCDVDSNQRTALLARADALAGQGYRVLALAIGPAADVSESAAPADPTGLEFLGFVGMIDPLRPGVREAVAASRAAGIEVSMITGDHPVTALAIARDLDLADQPDQVVTGSQLNGCTPDELQELVQRARVFARTTPRQKLELVEAARAAGHYVAVTGDGVNDAPALRQANIGVAMGRSGTDVAREAAELVVTDDNFATIVAGVEEGRIAYDNIRNVIYLLISTGAAEVVMLGFAMLSGWPATETGAAILPLLPAQLLWLNLVTNGIQDVALAFEPGEPGVLRRRPRPPGESIFNRLMIERTILAAITMAVVGFAAFAYMIEVAGWSEFDARNALLLLMVLFEIVHIGNCRSETTSALRKPPWSNPLLLVGSALAIGLHVLAMHWGPTQNVLGVAPVTLQQCLVLFSLAASLMVVMELHKWWRRRHPLDARPKS
ncbi:cation-translocating P-type ATPase [Aeoliella sp.]|uniref:cation-translocating P-type ATPase n=1 Tax=Aeoliella sp. TaxID=2795800 RepID=UPI003CCBC2C6